MRRTQKQIGLAIVGAGRVGLFRAEVAARHGAVGWIGIAEKNPERAKEVAGRLGADFVTGDHRELLRRPEVTAAIIATDEHLHVDPVMSALDRRVPLLIEKPLATRLAESAAVLKAIDEAAPLAGGQGEGAHGRLGRRHPGDFARVHEPPGGYR